MTHFKNKLTIVICLLILISFAVAMGALSWKESVPLQTHPPQLKSTPYPTSNLPNGKIVLKISAADFERINENSWAIVQWRGLPDSRGLYAWHNVEGWQGPLTYSPLSKSWRVTWWVAPENLGEEYFRWAIFTSQDKTEMIVRSDRFSLPKKRAESKTITITID